jgi:phenylpropionate dioxygenase-like ring-hydroxylating dioxygenase large terminal subunit
MFLSLTQDVCQGYVLPLSQYDKKLSLVNNDGFYLLDNICPHQHSRIATCRQDHLTCPYHGLAFDLDGRGAGHQHCLYKQQCYVLQNMIFSQPVNCDFPVNTEHMHLEQTRIDTVNAPVEIIMDVFLDIEHIPVAHAGVYDQVGITSIDTISWSTFEGGSIQYVPAQTHKHVIEQDRSDALGAVWLALYPGTMVEWQPGALFVTVACPVDQASSKVHVFKYKDTRYSNSSWQLNEKVWEQAWSQDRALSENITSLSYTNTDQLKQHYRSWLNVMR